MSRKKTNSFLSVNSLELDALGDDFLEDKDTSYLDNTVNALEPNSVVPGKPQHLMVRHIDLDMWEIVLVFKSVFSVCRMCKMNMMTQVRGV